MTENVQAAQGNPGNNRDNANRRENKRHIVPYNERGGGRDGQDLEGHGGRAGGSF